MEARGRKKKPEMERCMGQSAGLGMRAGDLVGVRFVDPVNGSKVESGLPSVSMWDSQP